MSLELDNEPVNILTYGTLMYQSVRDTLIGKHAFAAATLSGYERIQVKAPDGDWYPALTDNDVTTELLNGVLLFDLNNHQVRVLDMFECVTEGWYQRRLVQVKTADGELRAAHIYMPGAMLADAERKEWSAPDQKSFDAEAFIERHVKPFMVESGLQPSTEVSVEREISPKGTSASDLAT